MLQFYAFKFIFISNALYMFPHSRLVIHIEMADLNKFFVTFQILVYV